LATIANAVFPDYEIGRREAVLGDEFKDDRAHLGALRFVKSYANA
jgi:hypothetical protein